MPHTEQELSALTAKALRPIAAELGITGASRMAKSTIISAILTEEAALEIGAAVELATPPLQQTPRKMPYGGHWAMSFPLARGGEGNVMQGHVDYCAAWGHATETHDGVVSGHCPRCGKLLSAEQIEAKREELRAARTEAEVPALLCPHGIDARRRCSICAEDTAEGVPPVLTPAPVQKDSVVLGTVQQEALRPIDGDEAFKRGQERYEAEKADNTLAPEYFARATRRGVETVIVLRMSEGRVHYRIIDAKTGRRSALYYMRELTFKARYVKVPS